MSCKFGKIIKKLLPLKKMSQTKPHPSVPPPPAKSNGEYFPWVFHVVIPDPPNWDAKMTRHSGWQILGERAGWSAVWYNSLMGKIQTEDGQWCAAPILFGQDQPNSYWWSRASFGVLYSETRLYKGARMAPLSQSTTTRSTGNIFVGEKKVGHSNTCGTVSSLFFPAQIICCT